MASLADGTKNGQKIAQVGGNSPVAPKPPSQVGGNNLTNPPKPGKQTKTGGNYVAGQKVP